MKTLTNKIELVSINVIDYTEYESENVITNSKDGYMLLVAGAEFEVGGERHHFSLHACEGELMHLEEDEVSSVIQKAYYIDDECLTDYDYLNDVLVDINESAVELDSIEDLIELHRLVRKFEKDANDIANKQYPRWTERFELLEKDEFVKKYIYNS